MFTQFSILHVIYLNQSKREVFIILTVLYFVEIILVFFSEVNLHPHLPDIADIIGWTDMKDIAISTNVQSATIESFKLDNPGQSREQTLQLLTHFNEKHSRMASRVLIENLKRRGKNDKADRVQRLLANSAGVVESA